MWWEVDVQWRICGRLELKVDMLVRFRFRCDIEVVKELYHRKIHTQTIVRNVDDELGINHSMMEQYSLKQISVIQGYVCET